MFEIKRRTVAEMYNVFLNFRRNFTDELSGHKVVRLVFNGHVLQPDTKTLRACGLFDNCVVHCLVHNPRPYSNLTTNQGNVLNEQGKKCWTFSAGLLSIALKY